MLQMNRFKRIDYSVSEYCLIALILAIMLTPAIGYGFTELPDCEAEMEEAGLIAKHTEGDKVCGAGCLAEQAVEAAHAQDDKEKAVLYYCVASELDWAGELDAAISLYEKSIGSSPSLWNFYGKGQALAENGQCERALVAYSSALGQANGYIPNLQFERASAAYECGQYDLALQALSEERSHSGRVDNYYFLKLEADIYLATDEAAKAFASYIDGISQIRNQFGWSEIPCSVDSPCSSPDLAALYEGAIKALCKLGDFEKAAEFIETAAAFESFDKEGYSDTCRR